MTAFQSDRQTLWRPEIRDGPEWKRLMCNSWILQTATRGFLSFTFCCPQLIIPSLSHSLFIHVHVPASFPIHGWVPPSPARLSLSSVDETTEGSETTSESRAGDEHQWMVRWNHCWGRGWSSASRDITAEIFILSSQFYLLLSLDWWGHISIFFLLKFCNINNIDLNQQQLLYFESCHIIFHLKANPCREMPKKPSWVCTAPFTDMHNMYLCSRKGSWRLRCKTVQEDMQTTSLHETGREFCVVKGVVHTIVLKCYISGSFLHGLVNRLNTSPFL